MTRIISYTLMMMLLVVKLAELKIATTQTYPNMESLLPDDRLNLYWDHDQSEITFELHSKNIKQVTPLSADYSTKYPGVALSNTSWILLGMFDGKSKSDAIVAWVRPNGIGHFSDRHMNGSKLSSVYRASRDSELNAIPVEAFVRENFTVIKFKRPILACQSTDTDQDVSIVPGKMDLFFAVGYLYQDNDYFINGDIYESISNKSIQLLKSNTGLIQQHSSCASTKVEIVFNTEPTGFYTNHIDLSAGVYRFFWNYTDTDLIGEVHVKTRGWVSLGLSPNGGMDQSDIMVAWVNDNDGKANFSDRFIKGRQLVVDKKQDWILISAKQTDSVTILKFRRSLKLCDPDDRSIEQGTTSVIFAYGPSDPAPGQDVAYHFDKRGTKSVRLINGPTAVRNEKIGDDLETIDFSISSVILSKETTTYYLALFKIPESLDKRHILKWELLIPKLNYERVHHLDTKECSDGMKENAPGDVIFEEVVGKLCGSTGLGWSVGGDQESYFPLDTGYPIGGDTDYKWLGIELHYDNPRAELGYIDKLTIRYHMTKNLRKNELGIMTIGAFTTKSGIFVPPGVEHFQVNGHCYGTCTQKALTNDLTFIRAMPHTHTTGVAVSTIIIRDDKEIGYLHKMDNFDFNYQQSYDLYPNIILKKGDELTTKCVFNTTTRTNFTYGGLSTRDEMCMTFFTYYPRNKNFKACFSAAYPEDVLNLISQLNKTGLAEMPRMDNGLSIHRDNSSKQEDILTILFKANDGAASLDKYADKMNSTIKQYISEYLKKNVRHLMSCSGEIDPKPYEKLKASQKYKEPNICSVTP